MAETIRQKKVAELIREELSAVFQKDHSNLWSNGMVTVSQVTMTPDLLEARVHLSFFQVKNTNDVLQNIKTHYKDIRHKLGQRIGKQVRRVPELHFFVDDTLDQVFRMEEIFKQIKK